MTIAIYQYCDPSSKDDDTRWIAAPTAEQADAEAKRRGWQPCGGKTSFSCIPADRAVLRRMGCDVIILRSTKAQRERALLDDIKAEMASSAHTKAKAKGKL